jgi:hypothetical protein
MHSYKRKVKNMRVDDLLCINILWLETQQSGTAPFPSTLHSLYSANLSFVDELKHTGSAFANFFYTNVQIRQNKIVLLIGIL